MTASLAGSVGAQSRLIGDLNVDCAVDWQDLQIFVEQWLDPPGSCAWANPQEDLVAHWKFDEGTGITANDSAGNNHGTIYNANWTTGQIGGALSFDGNGDYVSIPDDDSLDITNNLTISAWVKRTGAGSSNEIILSKYDGGQYSYRLFFRNTNVVRWWLSQNGTAGNRAFVDSTVTISDTNWHSIAATFKNGTLQIYIDGVDSTGSTDGSISSIKATDQPLFIGQENSGGYFGGSIDDVRIYNRVLSEDEIEALANGGTLSPDCADLDGINGVDMVDFAIFAENWHKQANQIVINEIHYDPDVKTEQVEFVELHNISSESVNLSGWYFSRGIDFAFPLGASIAPYAYFVIAQDSNLMNHPSPLVGDLSANYRVDWQDLQLFAWQWLDAGPCSGLDCADLDADNDVDMADFALLAKNWLKETTSDADFVAKFGFKPNGIFLDRLANDGENVELRNAEGVEIDQVDYQLGFPWPTVGDSVPFVKPPDGSGHSIQLTNPAFDNDLGGSWRSALPTPGAQNTAVLTDNIPPHIRQVRHDPEQPTSSDAVTITCKVTDPNGVASVTLHYQLVDPGSYIPITLPNYSDSPTSTVPNPDYEDLGNWTDISMHDDGLGGDQIASDDIYSVQLSDSFQTHRRLIRYRITVEDALSNTVTVPYADDPIPNFAYFVYDGVPAWSGAIDPFGIDGNPGEDQIVTYGTDVMRSLPVYHLISREQDVMDCQWLERIYRPDSRAKIFYWAGTLVYDGKVYDHISFRTRGGGHRYDLGKNFWKFDFKRGRYFQAQDNYGKEYNEKWDKLNLGGCNSQWTSRYRGVMGMPEAMSFKLFGLVGVPSSNTHWIHLRIIDDSVEAAPSNQYEGDLWGLYIVIEQMDGRFLDEHELLDGNLYKMDDRSADGLCERNNQGPTGVTDYSDVYDFINAYKTYPAIAWWLANVDVNSYYSYRTILQAVRQYDINYGKNYFYYLDPVTGLWSQLPWDLNITWRDDYGIWGNGEEPFKMYGLLNKPELYLDYQSRVREIRDLFFNTDQCYELIDEYAAVIGEPNGGGLSFVNVDRAMWDYNPVVVNTSYGVTDANYPGTLSWMIANNGGKSAGCNAGYGKFYIHPNDPCDSFSGFVQMMKDFALKRINTVLDPIADDTDIPDTPTITATGDPNFPTNNLTFETSAFSDPQGSGTFAAMKWRIGEVTDENSPTYDPSRRRKYEIEPLWESGEITPFQSDINIPASVVRVGRTYRVRCRHKDDTDRWSHWSDPIQFVAGEPLSAGILNDLRITELMYNPPEGSGYDNDEFEFIELKNTGPNTLDLTYVSFSNGITFNFDGSSVTSLDPCDFVLVVRNQAAFESRYGTGLSSKIAGQYSGKLDNGGEKIELIDFWNG
ncbi:MAG: LamG-like jellyroll fold domain-containing protein, partial [Planctomycetota bacterium]